MFETQYLIINIEQKRLKLLGIYFRLGKPSTVAYVLASQAATIIPVIM